MKGMSLQVYLHKLLGFMDIGLTLQVYVVP